MCNSAVQFHPCMLILFCSYVLSGYITWFCLRESKLYSTMISHWTPTVDTKVNEMSKTHSLVRPAQTRNVSYAWQELENTLRGKCQHCERTDTMWNDEIRDGWVGVAPRMRWWWISALKMSGCEPIQERRKGKKEWLIERREPWLKQACWDLSC